ncbi:toprim domain-containing protein [Gemmata massiliana]|uniref:toprim domain-containing protein n=1 Tax=Gemmata massiliana TaxID=1210884 RepID=UPI0013A6FA5B|nr:toprim domain-containing protein [Gemmata massiliana]
MPVEALDALPLIGFDHDDRCWTFPETDAQGNVIGILRRFVSPAPDGSNKKRMKGSRSGLTLPEGWGSCAGPVYVVEGPTDALAMHCAGLACVGRPSNTGGSALLAELLHKFPLDRPIVILGDNDQKGDGQFPGRDGAVSVATKLATSLNRSVYWALTPDGVKDVRMWLTNREGEAWPDRGRALAERVAGGLTEVAPPTTAPGENKSGAASGSPAKPPTVAEVLAQIGLSADLWHDAKQTGYATVGRVSYPVRSGAFRSFLVNSFRKRGTGKVPGSEAVSNALNVIEAAAVHDGPECPAHVRVAGHEGRVYLHLADKEFTVIEIDRAGWRECPEPPVRFCKPSGMLALPVPARGGDLNHLRAFLNVADDHTFALIRAWLVGALRPSGPFPLLVLLGEQGTAKSTTARVLKRLIDPSRAELRSELRDARDLMIGASTGWALAFDNVSHLAPWLSDALCRLSTGGAFTARALYTDGDEVIFEATRPLVLNGIEDFVTRGDLLERSVLIRHPAIPERRRRLESEFWDAFDAAHPYLLGALLDRVSAGLRELPEIRLDELPRMADFARFAVACEHGMGEEARFLDAYRENQTGAHVQALDGSSLPTALLALMRDEDQWQGAPAELLHQLDRFAPAIRPRDWPKQPNALTNKLRRLAPNLRRVHGLDVNCEGRVGGRNRTRVVRITWVPVEPGNSSSAPSAPSDPLQILESDADGGAGAVNWGPSSDRPQQDNEIAGGNARPDGADGADDGFLHPTGDHPRDEFEPVVGPEIK